MTPHADDCYWHVDQYPWECTCGVSRPKNDDTLRTKAMDDLIAIDADLLELAVLRITETDTDGGSGTIGDQLYPTEIERIAEVTIQLVFEEQKKNTFLHGVPPVTLNVTHKEQP